MSFSSFVFLGLMTVGFYFISRFCWSKIIEFNGEFNFINLLKFLFISIIILSINLIFCYTLLTYHGVSIVFNDGDVLPGINSNISIYTEKVGN